MISIVVMAALSIAPEANANIFKRHAVAAPAACGGCGAPAACDACGGAAPAAAPGTAPAAPADGGKAAPPAAMPKGDKGDAAPAPAPEKKVEAKVEEKKAEAPIEIPAALLEAINKSEKKVEILEYLANPTVSREARLIYLENTVRPALLPDTKK